MSCLNERADCAVRSSISTLRYPFRLLYTSIACSCRSLRDRRISSMPTPPVVETLSRGIVGSVRTSPEPTSRSVGCAGAERMLRGRRAARRGRRRGGRGDQDERAREGAALPCDRSVP